MPQKTKTGDAQPYPVVVEALTAGRASARTRKPALSQRAAKRGATPSGKSRSPLGRASFSAGSPGPGSENPVLVEAPAAPTPAEPLPKRAEPGSKAGAKKKTVAGSRVSGRSSSVKTQASRKPANAADQALQVEVAVESRSEQTSAVDGNGHFDHDEVARLAYSYWEARGYEGGSPEEDWYRARNELRQRRQQPEETRPRKRTRKT